MPLTDPREEQEASRLVRKDGGQPLNVVIKD